MSPKVLCISYTLVQLGILALGEFSSTVSLQQNGVEVKDEIIAGKVFKAELKAYCNGYSVKPNVTNYKFTNGSRDSLTDYHGYGPMLNLAVHPVFVPESLPSYWTPYGYFDTGQVNDTRTIAVEAQAEGDSCGHWDASSSVDFYQSPLTKSDPIDFFANTKFKPPNLDGGLSFLTNGGLTMDVDFDLEVEFLQSGYFGVIQLIKGYYQRRDKDRPWKDLRRNEPLWALDADNDTDYIVERMKVLPGVQRIQFSDSPGISLYPMVILHNQTEGVRFSLQFKTYFMFTPSNSSNPNADLSSIWYPINNGIEWEGNATLNWIEGLPKDRNSSWRFDEKYSDIRRSPQNDFPVWNRRFEGVVPELSATSSTGL